MRLKMIRLILLSVMVLCSPVLKAQEQFDKSAFYDSMAKDDVTKIDEQLKLVKLSSSADKTAFEGTLLMKKAALVKGASSKLKLFKEGHKKLEDAISKDNLNPEFHFLRLMIQEHAPGFLGYKNDLQKDSDLIKKSFGDLPEVVKHAISDYSKKSKILDPSDF